MAWEQQRCDAWLSDVFGYHALQLGLPQLDALRANRMPKRWRADEAASPSCALDVLTDATALPFAAASLDLVVLPHTLDWCADPHAALREVERVLVPEGRVLLFGFNPTSLWGLGHGLGRALPQVADLISQRRLGDWLRLLSFELLQVEWGCYRPDLTSPRWFERLQWLERSGRRAWPILGSVYGVMAIKRVHGMHLLSPAWKTARLRRARPVNAASREMK